MEIVDDYCCYNILKNDTYGRYAVASKNLEPGDLIISEKPFTYGPKSDSPPVCLGCHCGVDGKTLCSTCGWPVCNELCERLPIHSQNECVIFSKAKIKFTPVKDVTLNCPQYECIMPLRVLLTKEREEEKWEREVKVLESHCEKRKTTDLWRVESVNVVGFLHKVCKLGDRFPEELIHFACGILEVNAFIAPTAFGFEVRCIYPKSSLLTHSCVPNVGHYIYSKAENSLNFRIYVRAMVKIEKNEELLLTYTQTLSPTLFRRAHLREGKYFECSCRRCADPTELGTNLSTLRCTKCDGGWLMSMNPLDEKAFWKCAHCDFSLKTEEVIKLLHRIQEEENELHFSQNRDPIACREAFIKKYSAVLHPNHAILMSVKSSLSQLYGRAKGYLLEELPDFLLERKVEFCNEINEISDKIKPGLSRQRGRTCAVLTFLPVKSFQSALHFCRFPGWNFYELYAPLILLAKRRFHQREIDERRVRIEFEKAAEYLEEAAVIFSYEDPESLEGAVGKKASQTLKDLRVSIEALPK